MLTSIPMVGFGLVKGVLGGAVSGAGELGIWSSVGVTSLDMRNNIFYQPCYSTLMLLQCPACLAAQW